ncbi:hypothetical protein MKZ38_010078 [Zalerion maritima]|uniref:Uncharacterized protein n=1 Tax=Zalerion maritima TaxID=339359 RepID=A0AAD5RSN7_9PEZI|nr:hypothetical protein MKZ38_010078 [Zalerion maritima]
MVPSSTVVNAPSTNPTLKSSSHSGSGFPQGSLDIPEDANVNGIVYTFPEFDLDTGGGIMNKTKNCEIHLSLEGAPTGWQFGLTEVLLSGLEYDLEEGAKLRIWFDTFFSDYYPDRITMEYGPLESNGFKSLVLKIPENKMLWSSRGDDDIVNMNLRSQIEDSGVERQEGEHSTFGTEPLMGKFTYAWKECGGGNEGGSDGPSSTGAIREPGVTMIETMTDDPTSIETEELELTETMTDDPSTTALEETEEPEECEAEEAGESETP